MPKIASRLPAVGTTIFTEMSALAAETGAVNLGQGFPDFDMPPTLAELLARAVRHGKNQYAPMAGLPALREALAAELLRDRGVRVDAGNEITITSGATEALFNAILAVAGAGDEVIVLDPAYDSYAPAVRMAGATPVHVALGADFAPDWSAVNAAVTPRTRAIIVNTPHNPTGAAWSASDAEALERIAESRDLFVISDEVYEHIVFAGRHESALLREGLRARSFVVSSLGKTYHCTGWKIGYCIAPSAMTAEFRKIHQFNTFATNTPAQWAFAQMLGEQPQHAREVGPMYAAKLAKFRAMLARTRLRALDVAGTYFQLADYSAVSDLPDGEFARWLCTMHGVASIPLSPFYANPPQGQRLVRFCFAKRDETLEAAIRKLEAL